MNTDVKYSIAFQEGAISTNELSLILKKQSECKKIGAYNIFIGQVRNDKTEKGNVNGIEYSCYRNMAEDVLISLCKKWVEKSNLENITIIHSLGRVKTGEICLIIVVASAHRKEAINSCKEIVEEIKNNVPIWGKEITENDNYTWKINT